MCWFLWREENRRIRRKTLGAETRTNTKLNPQPSTHIWRRVQESNPGHSGGRQVLSPLRYACSPAWLKCRVVKQVSLFQCGGPPRRQFRSLPSTAILIMLPITYQMQQAICEILCVCFKTSPRSKPFTWQWLWFTRKCACIFVTHIHMNCFASKWACIRNTYSYELLRKKRLVFTQGKNSEL